MGAHVWGPAFLRDNLLPELRLSGWTPDWYAGFPAYQFYMVIPSLLIVALDVGIFGGPFVVVPFRSEEHTSELQSLMRISYAVFCLKKKIKCTRYPQRVHISLIRTQSVILNDFFRSYFI